MSDGPDSIIYEEDVPLFLADDFTPDEAADERGLLGCATVTEEWHCFRDLTDEEKADDEAIFDLFGGFVDTEFDPIPTRIYRRVKEGTPGAAKYLRVTEKPGSPASE